MKTDPQEPNKPTGRCYESVAELREASEGRFCEKRCPKCGSTLLRNKLGDEWCSLVECDFGIETGKPVTSPCVEQTPEQVSAVWLARFIDGMRRDTHGLFVDQSTRAIFKSKDGDGLKRIAEEHNQQITSLETRLLASDAELARVRAVLEGAEYGDISKLSVEQCRMVGEAAAKRTKQIIADCRNLQETARHCASERDTALARIAELESDLAHERRLALQAAKDK